MTPDNCPPSEHEALRQRVAELEGPRISDEYLQAMYDHLEAGGVMSGITSRNLLHDLIDARKRVAELEGEVWEARAKALKEAAKLCEQHSRFYELHPEAAAIDPVEFQGAYSTGALKCAQIIRELKAEVDKEAGDE
jgi:hypothetical protein